MRNVYFIGIGGIGMSALARYFMREGKRVAGYDLTESDLTRALAKEGASIHYDDNVEAIPAEMRNPKDTLVVYTPAVPSEHSELVWFRTQGFEVLKRSEILGHVTAGKYVMAVSGTHGKTSTTTMVAWLNRCTTGGGSAFLGGLSKNFDGNIVMGGGVRMAVEADEFDRSFLRLTPDVAVITSADADHLDIYGTHEAVKEAFAQFVSQIRKGGAVIMRQGAGVTLRNPGITRYSYSIDGGTDFYAQNLRLQSDGLFCYNIVCPDRTIKDCKLGVPGRVNVENSIAAVAAVWCACKCRGEEFLENKIKQGLASFSGVKRRFDLHINRPDCVYMDDYAHHPAEISAALKSVRSAFPGRHITAVFQPHLYSRTNDFHAEFAQALSGAEEVILLPIYPARELPMEGVTSELIGRQVSVPCTYTTREELPAEIVSRNTDIVITFGAGNIDACIEPLTRALNDKYPAQNV
ncbi:MAG: UDP-N-acetylmuramate--L-alanine ligase [Rikenellaceae bacterium]|nr:UDP-N-acetylmuramate--L-alanine ligase [Rikenellaceae bacterium]